MSSPQDRDPRGWPPPADEPDAETDARPGTDRPPPPPPPGPDAGLGPRWQAPPATATWPSPPPAPEGWPTSTPAGSPPPAEPAKIWPPAPPSAAGTHTGRGEPGAPRPTQPWAPLPSPPPGAGSPTRPAAPWEPAPAPAPDDDWEPRPVTPWAPTAPPDPPVPPGSHPGAPLADPWAAPATEPGTSPWTTSAPAGPDIPRLSPAYSTPASPAYAPGELRPPGAPPLVATPAPPSRRRRWVLPALAVVLVAALAAGAFVVLGGGEDDAYAFGTVGSASGALVRTGGGEARDLEEGETVRAGWVIEAAGGNAVTVELAGGGVVRADSGATLSFVEGAQRSGEGSDPAPGIEVAGGRTWLNPVNEAASSAVALEIPEATVVTTGNPVAIDCTAACGVEAPAGGVTVTTTGDLDAAPAPNEIVTVQGADALGLTTGTGPSAWAGQNLDADTADGLPAPVPVETTGVKGTAVADGTYKLNLVVNGDPTGDPIPDELTFVNGQNFTVDLVVDGSGCVTVPCDVPVSANDGATGTARIENGAVNVSFTQPIHCYDESFTDVVVPDIGTTAVQASLRITEVTLVGERWEATSLDGEGTVAATLSTPCNAGETLGTATTTMVMQGPRAS